MEEPVYTQFYNLERDHWWFAGMRLTCKTELDRVLRKRRDANPWCVDIGCGTGLWTQKMAAFGRTVGIDLSEKALSYCKERGLTWLTQSAGETLPFGDRTFELVTALGVIEHLDDDQSFLCELRRVCKPQGYVLLLTSAYQKLWSHHDDVVHHKRRYARSELHKLLVTADFEVSRVTYVNTFLLPLVLLVRGCRKIFKPRNDSHSGEGTPDIFMPSMPLNVLLFNVLRLESKILEYMDLPFGLGLLALAKRPS